MLSVFKDHWRYTLLVGLFAVIILVILAFLALLFIQTLRVEARPLQQEFVAGHVPEPPLNGFLRGSVPGWDPAPGRWQGKRLDAAAQTGKNVFLDNGKEVEKFPFRTSIGRGVRDDMDVLKIDYNIPGNPLWLRTVLDEVVEVSPGKYLGKAYLRIIPGLPSTVVFFRMGT